MRRKKMAWSEAIAFCFSHPPLVLAVFDTYNKQVYIDELKGIHTRVDQ